MERGAGHRSLNKFYLVTTDALTPDIRRSLAFLLTLEAGKTMTEFIGSASALSREGLAKAVGELRIAEALIWAVVATETGACGYLRDRRPCILYERHVFWKLTSGRFSDRDVSSSEPGGYKQGPAEYDRLLRAISLDESAALMSASWGLGQILGENYAISGFESIQAMVTAMTLSEDAQLLALSEYLKSRKLDRTLRSKDWAAFALKYNGRGYLRTKYDERLKTSYNKYSAGNLPDLDVRAAQLYLSYLGFYSGSIDGVSGANTTMALRKFQQSSGFEVTGKLDNETSAHLKQAVTA